MPDQQYDQPIARFHDTEDTTEEIEDGEIAEAIAEVLEEVTPLSPEERQELGQLEEKVSFGLKAYQQAGLALQQILEKKLFREFHPSFCVYCERRWGISRSRASRLIEAAQVVKNLVDNCKEILLPNGQKTAPVLPDNERQVRELAKLPVEKQPEIWRRVVETAPEGKVTADYVQEVVRAEIAPDPEWESIREMRAEDPRLRYMNPHLVVGEKLREAREDRDIPQEELIREINKQLMLIGAIQLPLCQSAISVIENGKRSLSLLEAIAAAKVLGISVYALSPWRDLERRDAS